MTEEMYNFSTKLTIGLALAILIYSGVNVHLRIIFNYNLNKDAISRILLSAKNSSTFLAIVVMTLPMSFLGVQLMVD